MNTIATNVEPGAWFTVSQSVSLDMLVNDSVKGEGWNHHMA